MPGVQASTLRAGLVAVTIPQAGAGAWQLLLPRSFYDDFPLPGHPWVAMLPAYNEHLMRDVGALNLAMAVVVGVAAVTMQRLLVRTAVAADLVFAVSHFAFHTTHLEHFPPADAIAQTTVLTITLGIPIVLLILTRKLTTPAPGARGDQKEE